MVSLNCFSRQMLCIMLFRFLYLLEKGLHILLLLLILLYCFRDKCCASYYSIFLTLLEKDYLYFWYSVSQMETTPCSHPPGMFNKSLKRTIVSMHICNKNIFIQTTYKIPWLPTTVSTAETLQYLESCVTKVITGRRQRLNHKIVPE
jgi:hypothetical protein